MGRRAINLWPGGAKIATGLPHGTGSVYWEPPHVEKSPSALKTHPNGKRRPGRYVASTTIQGRRTYRRFPNPEDAIAWLREVHELWAARPPKNYRTEQFLRRWMEETKPSIRPSTYAAYSFLLTRHAIPALGKVPVRLLSPSHIQRMLDEAGQTLAPRTVAHLRTVVANALGRALRQGLITTNPAAGRAVVLPRVDRAAKALWDAGQTQRFLNSVVGDSLEAVYVVALTAACRQGELLGLTWSDLDVSQNTLTVRRALGNRGGLQLQEPKTRAGTRTIPLPEPARTALEQHRKSWTPGRAPWPKDLIFTTANGTPIAPRNLSRSFATATKRAGLPRIAFHSLRHIAISTWALAGVPVAVAGKWAGHGDLRTTFAIYTSVGATDSAAYMDRVYPASPGRLGA